MNLTEEQKNCMMKKQKKNEKIPVGENKNCFYLIKYKNSKR